jgi:aspartyl-tRNA(Asn)/glutamyl-tRNA(Gln) amidotransferase subunit A
VTPVCEWSVAEIARAIRSGDVTSGEVTAALLEQARRLDPLLACFIDLAERSATKRAAELDGAGEEGAGPLSGVPFAHKDIFVRDGVRPTGGARAVPMRLRARTSTVLERLDAAGAVSLGTLNLDQFGYAATGANPDFGDTRNPWDLTRIAGGSSSGAAAAVASGIVPFALGSDTGGSVRIPASFCGVVGIKPTFGRIPRRGAMAMSYSQDTIGILTRSVQDAALVLDVTAGHDPEDPGSIAAPTPSFSEELARRGERLDGVRLGLDPAHLDAGAGPEARAALAAAIAVLEGLGARVVEVDLRLLARCDVAATVLTWAEIGAAHGPAFARHRAAYAPATRARLDAALLSHGADHVDALRFQGRALATFCEDVLSRADVLVTATTGSPPATIEAVTGGGAGAVARSVEALRLNRPFNFLGLPAMSLPMGFGSDGMPMGMQLVARPWGEAQVLACGAAYQRITDWHQRRPPVARADEGSPAA